MNEEQTISSSCQQDIGSNGRKEDIICWYELLILHIHLSTANILPTIIMVFVVVCGMLPLVFALSSTKLSIFTLVDLVLLATFTVTSRGRKIQLTTRGQLRCIQPSQTARRWTPYLSISVIVSFSVVGSYVGIV